MNPGAIRSPPPEAFPADHIPIPDRWRLIQSLGIVRERWWDPYNQNTLKGDRPICLPTDEEQERRRAAGIPRCATPRFLGLTSEDWFFAASAISDTVVEPRSFPIPVGEQTTERPGQHRRVRAQRQPGARPDLHLRRLADQGLDRLQAARRRMARRSLAVAEPIMSTCPSGACSTCGRRVGSQPLRLCARRPGSVPRLSHRATPRDRYDFYSLRVGIQPFQARFPRLPVPAISKLGFRLFGNRDNNRFQFNLAAIWRLEKDTNSGLNNILQTPRDDWILHANVYRQDFPLVGLTSELSLTWNINRERDDIEVDDNGFPVRPALIGNLQGRNYDAFYIGYNADGRIGRMNLSASAYGAVRLGPEQHLHRPAGADRRLLRRRRAVATTSTGCGCAAPALFASGDDDPFDNVQRGFDAIFENPIFAGADTSYWIRQTIPFAGGGRAVSLNGRNGILNNLRSSKEQGQSNFVNPGTMLLGAGADFDLTPAVRLSANANHLWFHQHRSAAGAAQAGHDPRATSAGTCRRRRSGGRASIQNVVFRASAAVLQPGKGFRDLFTNVQPRQPLLFRPVQRDPDLLRWRLMRSPPSRNAR